MKQLFLILFFFTCIPLSQSEPALIMKSSVQTEADFILGTWLSENKEGKILVYKEKDKYFGKVSWIKRKNADNSAILDFKNPDPVLKKQEVLGLVILKGFNFAGDDLWNGGTIYDPLSGNTYSSRIVKASSTVIKIRGFIGLPMFGRTTVWTRVN